MSTANVEERERYEQYFDTLRIDDRITHSAAQREELQTTPLVSLRVKQRAVELHGRSQFPQYGLLGRHVGEHGSIEAGEPILLNFNAPQSVFICGSQGSGKSYTLSAMLENCLRPDASLGKMSKPLTGVVFHYDSNGSSTVAEAASLCSMGVKVRVLVSRSWYHKLNESYRQVPGATPNNMEVQRLLFQDSDLEADRIVKLMSFSDAENSMPLYMGVLMSILRDTAVKNQPLKLSELERRLEKQSFSPSQKSMLDLRMQLLKSFCASAVQGAAQSKKGKGKQDLFSLQPGTLTIIDLTDPFVDASTACVLFDICLSLIMSRHHVGSHGGLVIALDEAHKFLNKSPAATNFTDRLEGIIRMQRHYGSRVLVATQEPTVSMSLLDLCSTSIVHRFTSPAWFTAIKEHLSGASGLTSSVDRQKAMFERIVRLPVGESLVFSTSSYVCMDEGRPCKLGSAVMVMKTRLRKGTDAGRSKKSVS